MFKVHEVVLYSVEQIGVFIKGSGEIKIDNNFVTIFVILTDKLFLER